MLRLTSLAPEFRTLAILIVIVTFIIIVNWRIFIKAGQSGWKSLIPVYNLHILYKKTKLNGWYRCLLTVVPIIASLWIVFLVLIITNNLYG